MNEKLVNAIKNPGVAIKDAIDKFKGRDIETLIEEFSSEMAMVIEGISNDQERLGRENDDIKERLNAMEDKLAEIEKRIDKKPAQANTNIIRQITWLAGIIIVGLIIITLLNVIGGR